MKIVITGAGGFIGGHLTRFFLAQKWEVTAIFHRNKPQLNGSDSRMLRLIQADLSQPIRDWEKTDYVLHAAATHPNNMPVPSHEEYFRVNEGSAKHLCESARAKSLRGFIYISAAACYGTPLVPEVDETTPPHEPDDYGQSKLRAEEILKNHSSDFPVLVLRLPGVVGKGGFIPWLGRTLHKAIRDEDIPIYNPDAPFNNVTDLDDIEKFLLSAIKKMDKGFELINIAAVKPITLRQVVGLVLSGTASHSRVQVSFPQHPAFLINSRKATSRFGFKPSSTTQIVERYVRENS